jgi:hypothetical protein
MLVPTRGPSVLIECIRMACRLAIVTTITNSARCRGATTRAARNGPFEEKVRRTVAQLEQQDFHVIRVRDVTAIEWPFFGGSSAQTSSWYIAGKSLRAIEIKRRDSPPECNGVLGGPLPARAWGCCARNDLPIIE